MSIDTAAVLDNSITAGLGQNSLDASSFEQTVANQEFELANRKDQQPEFDVEQISEYSPSLWSRIRAQTDARTGALYNNDREYIIVQNDDTQNIRVYSVNVGREQDRIKAYAAVEDAISAEWQNYTILDIVQELDDGLYPGS